MRDVGAARRAGRPRGRLLRLLAVVLAVLTVALCGQPVPSPRLETASTQDPAPPASVVVTAADRALAVSWSASTETATSGYRVFLDAETTPRATTNAATRSATLTGLVNGQEYAVTVRTAALDPRDTNRLADVYRLDVAGRTWTLVSAPQGGTASPSVAGTLLQTGPSVYATGPSVAVSADGRLVLFHSAGRTWSPATPTAPSTSSPRTRSPARSPGCPPPRPAATCPAPRSAPRWR